MERQVRQLNRIVENLLDASRLVRGRVVVDGRNCLDGPALTRLGFAYVSVGRTTLTPD